LCNLYSLTLGQAAILAATRAMRDTTGNLPPLPGIFPDYPAPIVRNGDDGVRELVMARWGMPSPAFALKGRKVDKGVTNIRNTTSPHWRRWLGQVSRCVVPFTSFSENEHRPDGKIEPVWFAARANLDAELQRLREEVAAARAANAQRPDTHDYGEAATRDHFIDLLLREVGWDPDRPNVAEYEVTGMPYGTGQGFVDYVLWGDDGRPLALVEAKATRHSPLKGQQQAKLYADCLQAMHGQRPIIFCSNGYEHWIWGDTRYPPREVQGFYKKAELLLLIQRRTTRRRLADAVPNPTIVERHYQTRAIRRIAETFEDHNQRKALVVMATGAGKTRTVSGHRLDDRPAEGVHRCWLPDRDGCPRHRAPHRSGRCRCDRRLDRAERKASPCGGTPRRTACDRRIRVEHAAPAGALPWPGRPARQPAYQRGRRPAHGEGRGCDALPDGPGQHLSLPAHHLRRQPARPALHLPGRTPFDPGGSPRPAVRQ
jgi:hypothetical protein